MKKGRPKLDINLIRKSFEKEGYELLTNFYFNSNRQKLQYICPKGHIHSITWGNWSMGTKCPYCKRNAKPTIEFIKSDFEKYGYTLLDNIYLNSYEKLNYLCPLGHKHNISWNDWYHHKQRCRKCRDLKHSVKISGQNHPQWNGGVSNEPYCDVWVDKDYKDSIKERDGNKCLNPVCKGHIKKVSIHHIDYNKKNCKPDNLITLCISCNSSANFNRKWHKAWYQAIIKNRIGRN